MGIRIGWSDAIVLPVRQEPAYVRDLIGRERDEHGLFAWRGRAAVLAKIIIRELTRIVALELVDDAVDLLSRAAHTALRSVWAESRRKGAGATVSAQ